MNLLQIFLIISAIIILILAVDVARKERFNALHFLVFFTMGSGLLVFTFFPNILDAVGGFFGLQRGADLLVYSSIIFLVYFVLLLLSKHVENKDALTKLVRENAIEHSQKKIIEGNIVFIVRVYNEASVLEGVIREIIDSNHGNILIVNDGSTDNSRVLLEKFGNKITLLNHLQNRGGGAALRTAFEYLKRYGKTQFVVTFDADGQHSLTDLNNFIQSFKENEKLDIVLGSRFIEDTKTNVPLSRRIILSGGKIFTYFMSNIYLTDSHNGYRMFKLDCLDKIEISMDGMEYASEIIESIGKYNLAYKEVPVNIKYTQYSLKKGQHNSNALSIAGRFIWSKFFR